MTVLMGVEDCVKSTYNWGIVFITDSRELRTVDMGGSQRNNVHTKSREHFSLEEYTAVETSNPTFFIWFES
jgi:hypothetical protein